MKVLVVGGNGREHAIVWKLSQSSKVDKIYCAPGNAGISKLAESISIKPFDIDGLIFFVQKRKIDLTIVGPELPLVNGIVDRFNRLGLKIFGPEILAAKLEGSKIFAKKVMKSFNIPTADFLLFDDPDNAKRVIKFINCPLVIKADGLAAGKGVFVCNGTEDSIDAVDKIMVKKIFGESGRFIVVEKRLEGVEISFMIFTDGNSIASMPVVLDNKKLLPGNKGPNTGGVGCIGPYYIEKEKHDKIINTIIVPLLSGLSKHGIKYKGVLYAGLIIDNYNNPKVLEFNVRLGDPECQILMMLLETDLIDIIEAIEEERLGELKIKWKNDPVKTVALISDGYPGKYKTGYEINGLDIEYPNREFPNTYIFHGGTRFDGNKIVTDGGRVLYVTTIGKNIDEENRLVINNINFKGKYYREDI